ncbi:hypothetical protein [Levilactobacillus brevis]|uniref:hypothetical protein n=1 Tax=Levilactobacillus brevis TaxID=1580 RepID=UPI003D16FF8D
MVEKCSLKELVLQRKMRNSYSQHRPGKHVEDRLIRKENNEEFSKLLSKQNSIMSTVQQSICADSGYGCVITSIEVEFVETGDKCIVVLK